MISLTNAHGTAVIDPYGGQVMSYIPAGGTDVLWVTGPAHLAALKASGKALRGGVPVCWPWFGPYAAVKDAPAHGLARIATWAVGEAGSDHAMLRFSTDGIHPGFPFRADAILAVRLGAALEVALTTTNRDTQPFRLTQCLHTYLRVGDVGRVEILGLEDAVSNRGDSEKTPLTIAGEVDRIYRPVAGPLTVRDPALGRALVVENGGCTEAVVWNPGSDKADMDPGSYRNMLCVEPANVADAPTLAPGATWTLLTRLSTKPLS